MQYGTEQLKSFIEREPSRFISIQVLCSLSIVEELSKKSTCAVARLLDSRKKDHISCCVIGLY